MCLVWLAEGGVFGVPLGVLLLNDQQKVPTASIPLVVQEVRELLTYNLYWSSHCIQVP